MTKAKWDEIAQHLNQLKNIYVSIGESKFQKELTRLVELIEFVQQREGEKQLDSPKKKAPTALKEKKKQTASKAKKSAFEFAVNTIQAKSYKELKGTKLNYEEVNTSEDVIAFVMNYEDKALLKMTTVLDLKLLYWKLTGDEKELKQKKEHLLQTIRRNIRARNRGEAFAKIM
ncbi:hypothetical protein LCL95_09220 [Bacillus timonensis]|nr:hypothetical protein [Bacillus timonensis]